MNEPDRRDADKVLVRAARAGGGWLVVLLITSLVIAGAETAFPAVLGRAVDAIVGQASRSWLTWCGAVVAVIVVADVLDDLAAGAAIARSTAWLRRTALRSFLDAGVSHAERLAPGDLAARIVGNAAEAGKAAPDVIRTVANLIPAVGAAVALALIDVWLCVVFVLTVPLLLVLLRAFSRNASTAAERYLHVQGVIAARLTDALSGARTIAAAGTTGREAERVLAPLPELHRHGLGMWRAQRRIAAQDALLVPLVEVAVLAVAGVELAHGRLTPGQLLAAGQYAVLGMTIGSAVAAVGRLARARAGAHRAAEVLAAPATQYGRTRFCCRGRRSAAAPVGQLEFRSVTVRAGGRLVLDRIDLVVPGGALFAVVGRSGSGKSLLAAVAGRLVEADEGDVLLDGIPLRMLARAELRRCVGYAFERPVLVGDTVADAISFGSGTYPTADVIEAAKAAQAHDFIVRLPHGYRTALAEAPMSGGEAQRVGLARAFFHGTRVLILDDVAASLDTVTEHNISQVLTGALSDRTRLVVAHRASTAARADRVVWLDGGRVRGVAPHDELWTDEGYRALFEHGRSPTSRRGVA